jgi:hypothetical protein
MHIYTCHAHEHTVTVSHTHIHTHYDNDNNEDKDDNYCYYTLEDAQCHKRPFSQRHQTIIIE